MDLNNRYKNQLYEIIHKNKMFDYEEVNMTFITTKLIKFMSNYGKKLSIILRSDIINADTYWFIRYFRSKQIEPLGILSTNMNSKKYSKGIMGIPIVVIDEINADNTKNYILLIINRESDLKGHSQVDYRESDYGFCMRARVKLEFARERGIENYYYILQNENKYYKVIEMLEDDESKKTFIEVVRSLIENDIYRYNEYSSELKYFDNQIYKSLGKNEVWINCGSCLGDTILHYLIGRKKFKKIYAVEIDTKMIEHLVKMIELFPENIKEKIIVVDKFLQGKKGDYSIDNLFESEKITLINMDIEGFELTVLDGARYKIKTDNPVLSVAAYHRPSDLLVIPEFLKKINNDYRFFFRKYRGYSPEVLYEYIYYAVPSERIVQK